MGSDLQTVEEFLSLYYGGEVSPDDRCAIWTLHNKRHHWCPSIKQAASCANGEKDRDTYFSVGLYPKGSTKRTAESVSCIFGTWLDIDCGDKDNGKSYFPTIEDALGWVDSTLVGMWSIIVNSGRGLHVYLLFDEPYWISSDLDRRIAQKAVRAYWSWASANCPYDIDAITDLSRIMRLPGTRNTKSGEICHLIDVNEHRTSITELLEQLPDVELPAGSGHVATIDGDVDTDLLLQKIAMMCGADMTFHQTWERKRRFKDSSPSAFCLSLANQMVDAGLTDSEIFAALVMWRKEQPDADEKPDEWYATTIGKAREGKKEVKKEIEVDKAIAEALSDQGEGARAKVVGQIFGAELLRFVKQTAPDHRDHKGKTTYKLVFTEGEINVPSSADLLNQGYMKVRLFEDLNLVMKKVKSDQYDNILRILLQSSEIDMLPEEANEAFNLEQELKSYYNSKVEQCQVCEDIGVYRNGEIYRDEDGLAWFGLAPFKQRLNASGAMNSRDNATLATLLRELGCKALQFSDVKRTRLWSMPEYIYE